MADNPYRKFLLLLSSDNDGEVVASVRAIGRKLKAEGKDWYWFADQFRGASPEPKKFTYSAARGDEWVPARSGDFRYHSGPYATAQEAADALRDIAKEWDEAVQKTEKPNAYWNMARRQKKRF